MAVDVADSVLDHGAHVEAGRPRSFGRQCGRSSGRRDRHRRVADRRVDALEAEYVVPSPFTVLREFPHDAGHLTGAVGVTMRRAAIGFAVAIVIGGAVGIAVARVKVLRAAIGSMITGLQTMPSVAWVPLAIILFQLSERAILFVVVLGAAPSIANGIIDGIDHVPPLLLRAGRVLGAAWVLCAALRRDPGRAAVGRRRPEAGLGVRVAQPDGRRADRRIPGHIGIGQVLNNTAQNADFVGVFEAMIVIFVIGVVVDAAVLRHDRPRHSQRYGLIDAAAS